MSEGRNTELVSSWREAMEGVTPGPWRPSRFGFQVVSDYPEPAWQSVVELQTVARSEPNAEREMLTQQAIANWLARCSPSGISALLDALESASRALSEKEGENERLEAERYAQLAVNMENIDKAVAAEKRAEAAERACKTAWDSISRFPGSVHDRAMSRLERVLKGRNFDYADPDLSEAEERAESATRQRDEALAALKASEERGERLSSELASARLRPEPSSVEAVAELIDSIAECRSENAMDRAFLDNSDEIAAAVLKLIADRDGEWACTVNRLEDRIEGLNADLDSAVEVAFRRGAAEWTRLNYPTLHMRLSDPASQCTAPALEDSPADLADATKKDPGTEQREAGRG